MAELIGREALLLSTEVPHADASQGEDAAPWELPTSQGLYRLPPRPSALRVC